jgi:gamma-glutamylputrescine oxidase
MLASSASSFDIISSFWEKDTYLRPVDYLIVGAGITGLNAAISIKGRHPDAEVLVVEQGMRGDGASYRNAGFACLGSPTELLADLAHLSEDKVWAITRMRYEGLQMLLTRVSPAALGLVWCGGLELFAKGEAPQLEQVLDHLPGLNRAMAHITGHPTHFELAAYHSLPFHQLAGAIHIRYEGRLHPGKMMEALLASALQQGVRVLNGARVSAWEELPGHVEVHTADGRVLRTQYLGWATNGFSRDAGLQLPVYPARNQVYLSSPFQGLSWDHCLHYHQGYVYARRVGDQLLIGGARHSALDTEAISKPGLTPGIEHWLHEWAVRHLGLPPDQPFASGWSGTMGVGVEKGPLLHTIGNRIGVAVRLGGMGVAMGTLVGDQLANLMTA